MPGWNRHERAMNLGHMIEDHLAEAILPTVTTPAEAFYIGLTMMAAACVVDPDIALKISDIAIPKDELREARTAAAHDLNLVLTESMTPHDQPPPQSALPN